MPLIAIEGLDGTGKTSVSVRVAESLGATVAHVPPTGWDLHDDRFLSDYRSLARYLHYLSGATRIWAESEFGHELWVTDRFIASAHALHLEVRGSVADSLRGAPWPSARHTIVLRANERVRRDRLAQRGRSLDAFETRLEIDGSFRDAVEGTLLRGSHGPTTVIDTSEMALDDVASDIALRLRSSL